MAHMRAMIVFLMVVASAIGVQAQSIPEHLVTLNTRTFDLGTDASKLRRDPNFVPMNEIDWLGPILDADPLLGHVVFHLEMADPSMVSASFLWEWERGPDLPGNGWHYFYKYSQNIPERFRIPGYEARANTEDGLGSVMMIPADPDKDYAVMCDPNRKSGRLDFCSIRASYPPDPLIYLKARLYHPQDWDKTRGELDDMVARMREIAACLDVTGRELERNADGTPKLTGCKTGAGS